MSPSAAGSPATVHATVVVVGEAGILIRGPSGSGKSTLARRLLDRAERQDRFARLVADDRVVLIRTGGRLVARPVPAIAGRLEIRGHGLVAVTHERACVLRVVVDLVAAEPMRLPEASDLQVSIHGVFLPRIATFLAGAPDEVMWRLRGRNDTFMTDL